MDTYLKTYCSIDKERFQTLNNLPKPNEKFHFQEQKVNYPFFQFLFHKVGEKWNWTKRPKYCLRTDALKNRLHAPSTRLFTYKKGEKLIGYCLATIPENNKSIHSNKIIEIENFGLFPEFNGRGYGGAFLCAVFEELFKTYDHIFLTTRSTNHDRVVPFYVKHGMRVTKIEEKRDDIITDIGDDFLEQFSLAA